MRTLLLLALLLLQGRQAVVSAPPPRGGILGGMVQDWDGAPLARRWIIAVRENGRFAERVPPVGRWNNSTRRVDSGNGPERLVGEGWPGATCTDGAGRFRIEGLAKGDYRIFLQAEGSSLRAVELTDQLARTNSDDLQLQLRGQRLSVAVTVGSRPFYPPTRKFMGWTMPALRVECMRTDGEGTPLRRAPVDRPIEVGFGFAVFLVEPGHHYACVVDDKVLSSTRVWIEPGVPITRARAAIDGPHRGPASGIHVRVTDPDGRPYAADNQVRIYAEGGELEAVHRSTPLHRGPSYRTLAAPGTYRVQVSARDGVPSCGWGWRPGLERFGPAEAMCDVREGHETVFDVQLVRGGRVELKLESLPGVPTPEEIGRSASSKRLRAGESGGAAQVELIPVSSGERIPLEFTAPGFNKYYRSLAVLPGAFVTSHTIVPAGRYVVHARSGPLSWKPVVVDVRDEATALIHLPLQ